MTYTIIIPSAGGHRLYECLDSIDEDIREHVIVHKNAPDIDLSKYNVREAGDGINAGMSRSWNVGVRDVVENKKDYLIIVSQNTVFHQGMRDFVELLEKQRPEYGMWSTVQWHCTAFSRKTLEMAGEFDTNFYPIYYEDTEYATRLHLLGILSQMVLGEVDASWDSGYSTTLGMRPDTEHARKYLERKWGEVLNWTLYQEQNFYKTPFNNPENDIGYFEHKSIDELIQLYGYASRKHDLYIEDVRDKLKENK